MILNGIAIGHEATDVNGVVVIGLALGLASVHALPQWVAPFDNEGTKWLSAASGITIAFVFIELLPSIHELSTVAVREGTTSTAMVGSHAYVIVLAGFVTYHGIETMVATHGDGDGHDSDLLFWTHVGTFSLYNFFVGYKLAHLHVFGEPSYFVLFFVALAVHFLVTDYGLQEHHGARYDRIGRWIVIVAVLVGAITGLGINLDADVAVLAAFLAGGVVFNAINYEIRSPSRTQFRLLALSVIGYSTVLLIV